MRQSALSFFLEEMCQPFRWGDTDCASTADRWVRLRTGRSPLATFGRTYTDEAEAGAWLAERGGLALAVNAVMRASGFARTADPAEGDVGLVRHANRLCVAIWTGSAWVSRDRNGMLCAPGNSALRAWSIV